MFRRKVRIHHINKIRNKEKDPEKLKIHRQKKKHFQVVREITWPSFPSALIQTLGCIIAVGALAGAVWAYDYGINQGITRIISLFS